MDSNGKKTRCRSVDPLNGFLSRISAHTHDDDLKDLLEAEPALTRMFQERLLTVRVPKDQSPLVATILASNFRAFKYILDNFSVNLEQETNVVLVVKSGTFPLEGAAPLWVASALGRIEFVKLLLSRGVKVDHATDSGSTPLRGAAFEGNCEVCELLLEHGADINKPTLGGRSPLAIAASKENKECVEFLIQKGADVNFSGSNGDTPLHFGSEGDNMEVIQLLVGAGAQNIPNNFGQTPAMLASCCGHHKTLDYFNSVFSLQPMELYDCYCLLAAYNFFYSYGGERWLENAVAVRQKYPDDFKNLPRAGSLYDGMQEPAMEVDIPPVVHDEVSTYLLGIVYYERILGDVHPLTATSMRVCADFVLDQNQCSMCIDLWLRSLEFDKIREKGIVGYGQNLSRELLGFVAGLSEMARKDFIAPVEPLFQWGLKQLTLSTNDSALSKRYKTEVPIVVCCLSRLLAVWIKIADCIKTSELREKEHTLILNWAKTFVSVMEEISHPLLIAVLQNPSRDPPTVARSNTKLPLYQVLELLFDCGCKILCEDEEGNSPLHLAVLLEGVSRINCIRTLVEYGAHPDAVNFDGYTPLDLARKQLCKQDDALTVSPEQEMVSELEKLSFNYSSLQCLAAKALIKHGIPYDSVLPVRLVEFISWHSRD